MKKIAILSILWSSLLFSLGGYGESCENGAVNSPSCNRCPQGRVFIANQCAVTVTPPEQSVEINPFFNDSIDSSNKKYCPRGKILIHGQCVIHGDLDDSGTK